MTATNWLECTDPFLMLEVLQTKASERKLRLFAVACTRHAWDLLTDEASRHAVGIAERFADGLVSEPERANAENTAFWLKEYQGTLAPDFDQDLHYVPSPAYFAAEAAVNTLCHNARDAALNTARHVLEATAEAERTAERSRQAELLREIFGNPFRITVLDPAWLSWNDSIVSKCAQAIYNGRDFNDLPILADALCEAGCTNDDLLQHCRDPGPHVLGCWVLDLLVGKAVL